MMQNIITIENFSKSFGKKKAVDRLSFNVKAGEIFAFLGSNGSGKTTTIRCLLGILNPDEGTLLINGKPFDQTIASRLGYIPEERGLYLSSKVFETMVYFGTLKGLTPSEAKTQTTKYLKRVELLDKANNQIKTLSSGQQQKIQLGIAVINNPQLLILDEPTRGLDPLNRALLMQILTDLNKQGSTIVYISHQMEDVEKIADRLVLINKGNRMLYGQVDEVKKGFGTNIIHLNYSGKFPENPKLFKAKKTNHFAEITPNEKIKPEEILQYLIKNKVNIEKFEIGSPSLEDIFIKVLKEQ